jgi:RNA polymerase sigma-70 factor, ECF subfamily
MDFEEGARRHQRRVHTFAYYFLGNREEAEDVTQEVLLRLWRHCAEVEEDFAERWLLRVTRNVCLDQLRRRRQPIVAAGSLEDMSREPQCEDPSPESQAADASLARRLRQELGRLDEPYRSVLILREIQDLDYQAISDALGIPLNTVRVHIHRGRRRLRERLGEAFGRATH